MYFTTGKVNTPISLFYIILGICLKALFNGNHMLGWREEKSNVFV